MATNNLKKLDSAISSIRQDVEAQRIIISEAADEKNYLSSAPLTVEESTKRLIKKIQNSADIFETEYLNLGIYPGQTIDDFLGVSGKIKGNSIDGVLIGSAETDLAPLLCWLFKDVISEKLTQAVSNAEYIPGPPMSDRQAMIDALDQKIGEAEIEEEALIKQAESLGLDIERRSDCNIDLLLGLEEITESDSYEEQ